LVSRFPRRCGGFSPIVKHSFTGNSHLPESGEPSPKPGGFPCIHASRRARRNRCASRALTVPALAEDGVTADTITFGQAAVLEGPASALGLGMQMGLNAAFDEINAKGGVHGRKIKLISVNDGYEPDRAIARPRS
jgi:ABC-type branched-subunit amino acid transport system substrate-binding protein